MWAEQFGLGELGLSPDAFWSLEPREFWIKQAAFTRAEDRIRSYFLEHSLESVHRETVHLNALAQRIYRLRRYPIKSWLQTSE